jgi:hypothetical protein
MSGCRSDKYGSRRRYSPTVRFLRSSDQTPWREIQWSRVRFLMLLDYFISNGPGTKSTRLVRIAVYEKKQQRSKKLPCLVAD